MESSTGLVPVDIRATICALADFDGHCPESNLDPTEVALPVMRSSRPYRCRRIPACNRCRIRRVKCDIQILGQSCLGCRKCGAKCSAGPDPVAFNVRQNNLSSPFELQNDDTHVVSPIIARDTQVLDGHELDAEAGPRSEHSAMVGAKPVYRVSIPPRRPSPTRCDCSGIRTAAFLKQIEPLFENLLQLYLVRLHPCLPLLNDTKIRSQLCLSNEQSHTLITNLAAYTIFYWNLTPGVEPDEKLNQDSAWQVAVSTMNGEIQKSGILTIVSTLLNIAGRPSKGLISNMTNVARVVALSQSLGLNHDCSQWKISDAEKSMRRKLWWAVLIHDQWFHFAQGTPPLVNMSHYDVPLPSVTMLVEASCLDEHICAAQCYVALCQLTEVIGDILPLVYNARRGDLQNIEGEVARAQKELEQWRLALPDAIDMTSFQRRRSIPGLVNLQLSYLSTRMLIERLLWQETNSSPSSLHARRGQRETCRRTAETIIDFAQSLQYHELTGFWLPYNIQHFTSALVLLLRCAIQSESDEIRNDCLDKSRSFVSCMQKFRTQNDWDLSEIILPQIEDTLMKVDSALTGMTQSSRHAPHSNLSSATDSLDVTACSHENTSQQDFDCIFPRDDLINELFAELVAPMYTDFFHDETLI